MASIQSPSKREQYLRRDLVRDLPAGKHGQRPASKATQGVLTDLQGIQDATSKVNLDVEGALSIRYQQAYEASLRVISVIDDMLDVLINHTAAATASVESTSHPWKIDSMTGEWMGTIKGAVMKRFKIPGLALAALGTLLLSRPAGATLIAGFNAAGEFNSPPVLTFLNTPYLPVEGTKYGSLSVDSSAPPVLTLTTPASFASGNLLALSYGVTWTRARCRL